MRDAHQRNTLADPGDLLTVGFGIAIAMWACGYVARIPPGLAPNWMLFAALVACMVGGGAVLGRSSARGVGGGLIAGAVAGTVNLLVLGSLLGDRAATSTIAIGALGSIAVTAATTALGVAIGRRFRRDPPRACWLGPFAAVTTAATIVLIASGGLVTGFEAGLAVPDWPNTYGQLMFLYPLAKMTGGVYYEHAHRLYGSLVGLTTLVLAIYAWRVDRRGWFRVLVTVAFVLVVVQGVLGGLRVTGKPTLSTTDVAPSTPLAVVHGVVGQVFLALLTAIAVFASEAWRRAKTASPIAGLDTDVAMSGLLVGGVLAQLVVGACVRHLAAFTMIHITLGLAVFGIGLIVGTRAGGDGRPRHVRLLGRVLTVAFIVQLLLGIVSVVVTGVLGGNRAPLGVEVPFTSAHQVTGALLLATSLAIALFVRRLDATTTSTARSTAGLPADG